MRTELVNGLVQYVTQRWNVSEEEARERILALPPFASEIIEELHEWQRQAKPYLLRYREHWNDGIPTEEMRILDELLAGIP